jgi:putative ABC transport system substrate-binding protein
MKRREFLTILAGTAAIAPWATAVPAQHADRVRRVGVLMNTAEGNPEGQARIEAFRERLRELGWSEGRNLRLDIRWGGGDVARAKGHAQELVAHSPDVLLAYASAQLAAASRATRTTPTVFIGVSDPVSPGYVASFARPGGNITGFTLFEPTLGGKWLATLKEIAPATARAAMMANPDTALLGGRLFASAFQSGAAALGVKSVTADVRSVNDIEAAIAALGRPPNGGLIVVPESFTSTNRELIVRLAATYRVPAMYPFRQYPMSGGLMSYGPDTVDVTRRAASYIDRILRGEKPADLPVQAPTKFELVINLKTAKALGLTVPNSMQLLADEVIE